MANEPPFKIDEESYQSGREAFARGASLRSIVEQLASFGADQVEDQKAFSGVLGFGDALLDLLRNPAVVVQQGLPLSDAGFLGSDPLGMRHLAKDLARASDAKGRRILDAAELCKFIPGAMAARFVVVDGGNAESVNKYAYVQSNALRIEVES
ncbi:hypothetical protein [Rhodopseudomonas sp.]|uniref:hypothetical protein n=1 Tax=Rhodopseudomonas sp. TaxID=1078 RepID=UPI003B3B3EF0